MHESGMVFGHCRWFRFLIQESREMWSRLLNNSHHNLIFFARVWTSEWSTAFILCNWFIFLMCTMMIYKMWGKYGVFVSKEGIGHRSRRRNNKIELKSIEFQWLTVQQVHYTFNVILFSFQYLPKFDVVWFLPLVQQ